MPLNATIDRIGFRIGTLDEGGFADFDRFAAGLLLASEMTDEVPHTLGGADIARAPDVPQFTAQADHLGHLAGGFLQLPEGLN
jgi:hypothetical protein